MFGRSQSGPGGLSISTTSANTPFGQSSLPPTSTNKTTTSFFGGLSASQPQQNATTTQAQQTSSIFGQPQQTGGLFGSLNQTGNTQQQQPQQQTSTANLFGNTNQSQPQQTSGLFGSLGQPQTQSQQPQNSLFSGLGNANKASSAFGATQTATQNQPPPPIQPAPTSMFSSQIGQYQKQQTVPGVVIGINELRPTTRFNDLHEDLQKGIEYVDNFILSQIRKQEDCAAANPKIEDLSSQMPSDIEYCTKTLDTLQQALESDAESIAFAKNLVKTDFDDSKLSFKVIQNLTLPQQFHHTTLRSSAVPSQSRDLLFPNEGIEGGPGNVVDYFMKQANEMNAVLENYNRSMAEVEGYLKGIESNTVKQMQQMAAIRTHDGAEKTAEDQVRELAAVLREFGNGIMGVATKVGDTREKIQEVMLGSTDRA